MNQQSLFTHLRAVDDSYIVVTALQQELPTYLPEKILFTGVGKINATHVLTRYLERNPKIKTVINNPSYLSKTKMFPFSSTLKKNLEICLKNQTIPKWII